MAHRKSSSHSRSHRHINPAFPAGAPSVAPTLRSAPAVGTPPLLLLSALAGQGNVGPSSAGPRPNAVRPYIACAAAQVASPGAPQTSAKPFTQAQVQAMVRDGLADETGAKGIEPRGIKRQVPWRLLFW